MSSWTLPASLTSMNDGWYELVSASTGLTQGDIILQCPIIAWKRTQILRGAAEELRAATEAMEADVIVVTQACDLEHNKVENVLLCPHLALEDYRSDWQTAMSRRQQTPTEKAWIRHCDGIRDGFVWNLTMLEGSSDPEAFLAQRVVDFSDVYTIPRTFLESLVGQRGQKRLRLRPPYREHLSQAFARFFMRVGLPVPITKSW